MDKVPVVAMTLSTGTATWAWLATATDVVQLVAALVAIAVGVITFLYYRTKWKALGKK